MNKTDRASARSQVSLGMLLLLMMIASMLAAMFFYGSRIEEVQEELRLYFATARRHGPTITAV